MTTTPRWRSSASGEGLGITSWMTDSFSMKPLPNMKSPALSLQLQKENIIAKSHDDFGHFGIGRTDFLLQQQFYKSNTTQDVRNYINSCPTCQVKRISFLIPDKLHPLPIFSAQGNKKILLLPLMLSRSGLKWLPSLIRKQPPLLISSSGTSYHDMDCHRMWFVMMGRDSLAICRAPRTVPHCAEAFQS